MPDSLAETRYELAVANRILGHEGVLDAFGHVSVRHPGDPGRYLLSRSRSPELVEPADILEFTLDSEPVAPPTVQLYSERVIHGEIYKARPDVMAVCHHHAPADHAVLHHRRAAGAGVPSRRHHRRHGAVLGQPRRVRRHQSAGGEAGGGRLARPRARQALRGADAPARRDRGRRAACASWCSAAIYSCLNAELPQRRQEDRQGRAADAGRDRDGAARSTRCRTCRCADLGILGDPARQTRRNAAGAARARPRRESAKRHRRRAGGEARRKPPKRAKPKGGKTR